MKESRLAELRPADEPPQGADLIMRAFSHIFGVALMLLAFSDAATALNDAPLVFENIEAMRKVGGQNLPRHQAAQVLGYYAANDGGGGSFYWVPSADSPLPAPNSGTVIDPLTRQDSGRWVRLVNT